MVRQGFFYKVIQPARFRVILDLPVPCFGLTLSEPGTQLALFFRRELQERVLDLSDRHT